jgi:hypothetical protein
MSESIRASTMRRAGACLTAVRPLYAAHAVLWEIAGACVRHIRPQRHVHSLAELTFEQRARVSGVPRRRAEGRAEGSAEVVMPR